MYTAYRTSEHSPETAQYYEAALSWTVYRSAYSCCMELLKFNYSTKQRRQKINEICKLYRMKNVKPVGWRCSVIALPVKLGCSGLIDWLVCYKAKSGQTSI